MRKKKPKPSVPNVQAAQPVIQPAMKTWHAHAFIIITAVALYYLKWPILIVAAITLFGISAAWMGRRFPLTTIFIIGFLRGLFGSRRW